MDDRKEVLPLRIVAARFISADEQTGLIELDRIAADASRVIQSRYLLLCSALAATAFATMITLGPGIFLTLSETPGADTVVIIGLICFVLTMAVFASWRVFQYGGMKASAPQTALYGELSFKKLIRESVERDPCNRSTPMATRLEIASQDLLGKRIKLSLCHLPFAHMFGQQFEKSITVIMLNEMAKFMKHNILDAMSWGPYKRRI